MFKNKLMKEINSSNYQETVGSNQLSVIKFGATWCGPCKTLSPMLKEIEKENENVLFGEVDVDKDPDLAIKNEVKGVPTTIFFKNGTVLDKIVGLQPSQIYKEKIVNFN